MLKRLFPKQLLKVKVLSPEYKIYLYFNMKLGFHGHVEEAYLRFMDKKLKERRAALGFNPLLRDIYLKVPSKEAKSGAPISPILSPYGLNVNDFVTQFNSRTADYLYGSGVKIPTVVNVFENKSTKFYFTTLYNFFIISNNSNRYRLYKLKDLYRRFILIKKSIEVGSLRVWSKIDILYKRMSKNVIYNCINSNRLFVNKKLNLRRKRKKKKIKKNNILYKNDINFFKTMLSVMKGTKSLVYVNFNQLIKGNFFNLFLFFSLRDKSYEIFLNLFEREYLSRGSSLNKRLYKIFSKFNYIYARWLFHLKIFPKKFNKCVKYNLIYIKKRYSLIL